MALLDLLTSIDALKERISEEGPLSPEIKRRLDYRFRLDWNYHSNVMEGSSLTKLETRTIMLGNVTVDGKPIKDVLEMKGHDDVITKLLQMSSGELQLSEARIKQVHQAIVKEDDPERKEWVGRWKLVPNYLTNYRGERIDFTPPEQVAQAMHQLLDRTKADIERIERNSVDSPHPAVLAFDFHREYVTIHPFHDGNGRSARIFSNLLLMRFGFPPVVIRVDEKEAYNRLLAEVQVYGASPDLFNEFMSEKLLRSLKVVADAVEGRGIVEQENLEKRLTLLDKKLEALDPDKKIQQTMSRVTLGWMLSTWIFPLLERLIPVTQRFNRYFINTQHHILVRHMGDVPFVDDPMVEVMNKLNMLINSKLPSVPIDDAELRFHAFYGSFKHMGKETFGCTYNVVIDVQFHNYTINLDIFDPEGKKSIEYVNRLLHQPLTEHEQTELVTRFGDTIAEHLEYWVDRGGIPPNDRDRH